MEVFLPTRKHILIPMSSHYFKFCCFQPLLSATSPSLISANDRRTGQYGRYCLKLSPHLGHPLPPHCGQVNSTGEHSRPSIHLTKQAITWRKLQTCDKHVLTTGCSPEPWPRASEGLAYFTLELMLQSRLPTHHFAGAVSAPWG